MIYRGVRILNEILLYKLNPFRRFPSPTTAARPRTFRFSQFVRGGRNSRVKVSVWNSNLALLSGCVLCAREGFGVYKDIYIWKKKKNTAPGDEIASVPPGPGSRDREIKRWRVCGRGTERERSREMINSFWHFERLLVVVGCSRFARVSPRKMIHRRASLPPRTRWYPPSYFRP